MRKLALKARVKDRSAVEVFATLCRFEDYSAHAAAVKSLAVVERTENRIITSWEVFFQNGILRWTEEDQLLPDRREIRFRQIEGDIAYFAGEWGVTDEDVGCSVWFAAEFDVGVPSLERTLGPLAERALGENIRSILGGLLGATVVMTHDTP